MPLERMKSTLTLWCVLGLLCSSDSQLVMQDSTPIMPATGTPSTPSSSNLVLAIPRVSSLPPRPPSPGFHTLLNIWPRDWDCSDCTVWIEISGEPDTPSAQAWCVQNCPFEQFFEELTQVGRNTYFLRVVNKWIQLEIAKKVPPYLALCNAWNEGAKIIVPFEEMLSCPLACTGLQTTISAVSMQDKACKLMPGHISITPVQAAAIPYEHTSKQMFSIEDWRLPDDGSGTCASCSAGNCMQINALKLSTGGAIFADADIPTGPKALVFGWREFTTVYDEKTLKKAWAMWNSDDPLYDRIRRESRIDANKEKCAGATPSCLQNKAAVTGRACAFKDVCFTRQKIFGAAYTHSNTHAAFVVRGIPGVYIKWFAGQDCTLPDAGNSEIYSFDGSKNSFQLHLPLVCDKCPDTMGTGNFDPDTGALECDEPFSPFVLELSLSAYTGCSESVVFYKQVECDQHTVSVRRRPADRLRCAPCSSLLARDGFARGSHRPFMSDDCKTCVKEQSILARAAGKDVSAEIREILHPCGRCNDCRNCSAASTFDEHHASFCRPLESMAVLAMAGWTSNAGRLGGRDLFKMNEFTPAVLDADHFRDDLFQQQACKCNNRHKYAQFCGDYALRDQDAWMFASAGEELRLSLFTDAGMLARYSIIRAGVCQPCLACPLRHFNGACEQGREGNCALCLVLASCTGTHNPYLHHSHAEGCEQTTALSDYECRECQVWAKIGQDYMLLVGCGDQNLRRWTPTASSFDGVLDVGECKFDHGDAPASSMCRHAGVALERKRPFGNFSALMPYCPPGWFFKCAERSTTAPFDPECCAKCDVCPPEKSKNTATWRACSGASDYDTQSSNCVDRCENNMYEVNNTCLYCTTCKEGEL